MEKYHLNEPLWPTFVGSGADIIKWGVLLIGAALLIAGIVMFARSLREGTLLPPLSISGGLLLFVWGLGMVTQAPGVVQSDGFIGGQFLRYLSSIAQGDLGLSFTFHRPVTAIIGDALPNSFLLGSAAFLILVGLSLPLGVLAAMRQNTWIDYLASGIALVGYSIPNFVMGVFLILFTGLYLHLLPIAAWSVFPRDLLLPAIVLAIRPMAVLTRLTRASMIEVLNQDYIRTAWAKGLHTRAVLIRHALRNAFLPVVTVMGDHLGDLITGSIAVEYLFNVPGIGQWFVRSVQARDYGMIMGTTLFYACLVLAINLIVDLLYAVIDPRIKLGGGARS